MAGSVLFWMVCQKMSSAAGAACAIWTSEPAPRAASSAAFAGADAPIATGTMDNRMATILDVKWEMPASDEYGLLKSLSEEVAARGDSGAAPKHLQEGQ